MARFFIRAWQTQTLYDAREHWIDCRASVPPALQASQKPIHPAAVGCSPSHVAGRPHSWPYVPGSALWHSPSTA